MARVPRTALPDGYFHVSCRGVASRLVFPDGEHRSVLLEYLWSSVRRHGLTCYAACVLSTHYHVVLAASRVSLSSSLHWLNWRYAWWFNKQHEEFGHVFAERFSARVVDGEDRIFETCAYVLLNPVKAGLCERVEDWPWSYSRYGLATT